MNIAFEMSCFNISDDYFDGFS